MTGSISHKRGRVDLTSKTGENNICVKEPNMINDARLK